MKLRVVSVSGGKDSTATLLLALETNWLGDVRAVFADTGHESPTTYEYIDYLQDATGLRIDRVRADFTRQMVTKRENLTRIANGEPESAIYGARQFSVAWTPERAARAAALMVPTSMWTAPIGAHLAHRLSKRRLEIAFGVFLFLVSMRFVASLAGY